MSTYKISTGEDLDAEASKEYNAAVSEIEYATEKQLKELTELLTPERYAAMLKAYKLEDASEMSKKDAAAIIRKLKAK
jgi:hypothetical protein